LFYDATFLLDEANDGGSDDSDDKVGEVRFVPEDKSACKKKHWTNFCHEGTWYLMSV